MLACRGQKYPGFPGLVWKRFDFDATHPSGNSPPSLGTNPGLVSRHPRSSHSRKAWRRSIACMGMGSTLQRRQGASDTSAGQIVPTPDAGAIERKEPPALGQDHSIAGRNVEHRSLEQTTGRFPEPSCDAPPTGRRMQCFFWVSGPAFPNLAPGRSRSGRLDGHRPEPPRSRADGRMPTLRRFSILRARTFVRRSGARMSVRSERWSSSSVKAG
jgi:hypothetical protein